MASAQFSVVPTSAALKTALSEELVSVANVIHQFPEMPDILGRALQFHQLLVAKKLSLVDESVVPNEVNLSLANLSVLDDHLQVLVPGANVQGADILNAVISECTLCDEYLAHVIPRGISYRAVTGYTACLYRKLVELKFVSGGNANPQANIPIEPAPTGVLPVQQQQQQVPPMNAPVNAESEVSAFDIAVNT